MILIFDRFRADALLYLLTYGMVLGNVLYPPLVFPGDGEDALCYSAEYPGQKHLCRVDLCGRCEWRNDYIYVPLLNSLGWVAARTGQSGSGDTILSHSVVPTDDCRHEETNATELAVFFYRGYRLLSTPTATR